MLFTPASPSPFPFRLAPPPTSPLSFSPPSQVFNRLRDAGYWVETLGSPLTCVDPEQYGALLLVDSEDEFYPEARALARTLHTFCPRVHIQCVGVASGKA